MHPAKLELLKSLFTLTQQQLHDFLYDFLEENYGQNNIIEKDGMYLFAKGDIDVLTVAHLDTVHKYQPTLDEIYHDQDKKVLLSPVGIGADDRCGIFMIMNLVFAGYKPHIAFTWDEEIGGYGAADLAKDFAHNAIDANINFAIQYDRRGHAQSVYYSLYNGEFENYINSFGFTTNFGTYTDICEICPMWGMAGVNLSTGYTNEHSVRELVLLDTIEDTLAKSIAIMEDQIKNPKFFEYKELPRVNRPYSYSRDQGFPSYSYNDEDEYGYDGYGGYNYPHFDDEDEDDDDILSSTQSDGFEEPCILCGVETPYYNMVDEPEVATGICTFCYAQMYGKPPKNNSESFYKKVLKGLK